MSHELPYELISRLEFTPFGTPVPAIPLEKEWKPFKPLDYDVTRFDHQKYNPNPYAVPPTVRLNVRVEIMSNGYLREVVQKIGGVDDETPHVYFHDPTKLASEGGVVFRKRFQQMRVKLRDPYEYFSLPDGDSSPSEDI